MTVAAVAGVVGFGAIYGGVRLLLDAEALGVEQTWLEGTPFTDYVVPGIVLLVVVGGGMSVTAVSALRRSRFAGLQALTMGVALLAWGAVETLTIGYQGRGQLVLLGLFVVAPALPLVVIGWRATTSLRVRPTNRRHGLSDVEEARPSTVSGRPEKTTSHR